MTDDSTERNPDKQRDAGDTESDKGEPGDVDETAQSDPRLGQPHGEQGMPGEVMDSDANMPGDQPEGDTPPSRTKATGQH